MGELERGEVTVTARHEGLDEALAQLKGVANRLATSILMAALIVALTLLMLIYHPAGWEAWAGWLFFGLLVVASIFGLRLLWSIWRSR